MGMGMGMGDGRWEWQWQMPSSIVAGVVLSKPAVWRHSGGPMMVTGPSPIWKPIKTSCVAPFWGTDDGNRTIANLETNQNQLCGANLGGTGDGNRTIANLETNQNQLCGAILGDR